jgi:hypothetical protein
MFENEHNHYPIKDSSASHAMDAYLLMQYANLSGFDHVRALVTLIRAPSPEAGVDCSCHRYSRCPRGVRTQLVSA